MVTREQIDLTNPDGFNDGVPHDWFTWLRNNEPVFWEEMLRCAPAVLHFRCTALRDTVIRGTEIKEGDKIVMWYPSANRDEEIFDDPHAFNVARRFNEHLAFGTGEHYCLGASLARLQLNSIFRELLTRLPDIEVDGEVHYLRSNFIDGIKRMNVRFTPESQREQRAS